MLDLTSKTSCPRSIMRIAILPAILLASLGSLYSQTYRATPAPRPYYAPPLPPQRYVPGYAPGQNGPSFYYDPNGYASRPSPPQQTYAPPQNYQPSQTYIPQATYRPPPQPTPSGNIVKRYVVTATPMPTIAQPNYRTYQAIQPSTFYYPSPIKFTVPPPTPDEARIIWQEDPTWSTTAKNPGSSAFGLGQLLNSPSVPNRNTAAAIVSKQLGRYVDPNTTDPNLQLLMMRAYINWRYAADAARDHISPAAEAWKYRQANHWY